MSRSRSFACALLGVALVAGTAGAQNSHYHVVKTIEIGAARADYIIIDPVGRKLYGLGDKVIDVDNDNITGTIEGGGGGYAIDHEDNRGLVRNGTVFDLKTGAVTGHLDIKGDGSRYDPATHRAFVWVDKDGWVVDMRTGKLMSKTTIGDGLESAAADGHGKLYAAIEEKGGLEEFDTRSLKVTKTWDVAGCGRAQGLTMDTETRRVFMACDTEVVVLNADNGSVVSRIKVPSRADMNCFDPTTKLVFNPNRADSTLTVIHEDSPSKFRVVEKVPEGGAARTCAVDEKTHKVYVFYYEGNPRQGGKLLVSVLAP
jgi:DNA-binding beta-propeller fold protein YncE